MRLISLVKIGKVRTGNGSDNLVTRDDSVDVQGAPAAADSVDITATNTAVGDCNVDVVIGGGLELELVELEVSPVLGVADSKTFAAHDGDRYDFVKGGCACCGKEGKGE